MEQLAIAPADRAAGNGPRVAAGGISPFWEVEIRHGKPGRPAVPPEVRDLIRIMSRNNPRWDAPRIDGELLKPGIDSTEPTVAKYMLRQRKPPSHSLQFFTLYCVWGTCGVVLRSR